MTAVLWMQEEHINKLAIAYKSVTSEIKTSRVREDLLLTEIKNLQYQADVLSESIVKAK